MYQSSLEAKQQISLAKQVWSYLEIHLEKRNKKKIIKAQSQKINRLKKKLEKKRQSKEGRDETSLNEALDKLPENLAHFVRMQIKLHGKKKKGRRYSPQIKSIAVSLYHASGKAYRMLSKLFILPSKTSLRRYISKMPTATGISQGALNIIKKKVDSMSDDEKLCTLCVDLSHMYHLSPTCTMTYPMTK